MNNVIQLGPLSLNATVLLFVFAYGLWLSAVRVLSKRIDINYATLRSTLDTSLIVGLVGARLTFAAQYWESYIDAPWTIFYFWQSGYSLVGGIFFSALYALVKNYRTHKPNGHILWRTYTAIMVVGAMTLTTTQVGLIWLERSQKTSHAQRAPVRAMPFQFTDLTDRTVSFADYAGQPLVLNFWATWCPPCRREMPLLENTFQTYADQGVAVIAVNVDEADQIIRNYALANNLTLPIWKNGQHTTSQLFSYVDGRVMPTTLFIDAQGNVIKTRVGELSAATLQQGIESIQ